MVESKRPETHHSAVARWIYPHWIDAMYVATLLAITPYLVATRRARHSYGHILRRRGNVDVRAGDRPRLWIHGVSVGEVLSVRALVHQIEERFPEWDLVFSATSQAGLALVRRTFSHNPTFEYPFDFSWAVRRAMQRVRPDLILIIEHELWPNFLHQARLDEVPVVVVNAQVSDRSIWGYRLLSRLIQWPSPAIAHFCAQNQETLDRLRQLGVGEHRVTVTGNLKYDNPCEDARDLRADLGIPSAAWVLTAASTHPGEEKMILGAYRRLVGDGANFGDGANCRLILIPRKVDRADELAELIRAEGFVPHRRTQQNGGLPPGADPRGVLLVDTLGELPAFCRTGDVVFVGGTLVPFGGHNIIEPASLARPVIIGPHSQNFRSVVQDFQRTNAIRIARDEAGLLEILRNLQMDPRGAAAIGQRASQVVQEHRGASNRTFEVLARVMESIGEQIERFGPGSNGNFSGAAALEEGADAAR